MIVEPLSEKFWNESIAAFVDSWEGHDLREPELYEKCGKIIAPLADSVMVDLLKHSREKYNPNWDIMGLQRFLGAHLNVHSWPVLMHINFGIYLDKWFVETMVPYIDSLPNVTGEFWDEIAAICHTAPTTFEENEVIHAKWLEQKRFLKSGRSIPYCLVRNFILRRSDPESGSDDIGILKSEVGIERSYQEALETLRRLFRLYCRLVRHLYRPAYQKERRSNARYENGSK